MDFRLVRSFGVFFADCCGAGGGDSEVFVVRPQPAEGAAFERMREGATLRAGWLRAAQCGFSVDGNVAAVGSDRPGADDGGVAQPFGLSFKSDPPPNPLLGGGIVFAYLSFYCFFAGRYDVGHGGVAQPFGLSFKSDPPPNPLLGGGLRGSALVCRGFPEECG